MVGREQDASLDLEQRLERLLAIPLATASERSTSAMSGTTSTTRAWCSASGASISRPVRHSSRATGSGRPLSAAA